MLHHGHEAGQRPGLSTLQARCNVICQGSHVRLDQGKPGVGARDDTDLEPTGGELLPVQSSILSDAVLPIGCHDEDERSLVETGNVATERTHVGRGDDLLVDLTSGSTQRISGRHQGQEPRQLAQGIADLSPRRSLHEGPGVRGQSMGQ